MFGWFKKRQSIQPTPELGLVPGATIMPWWGDPIVLAGQANTGQRKPEDLDFLAEDGEGIYRNTGLVWGTTFADVSRRLSVETPFGGVLFFDHRQCSTERFEAFVCLAGVRDGMDYQVFSHKSGDPLQDGYWTQWRFVSDFARRFYYHQDQTRDKTPQPMAEPLIRRMVRTVAEEKNSLNEVNFDAFLKQRYNRFYEGSIRYGFGFLVENSYYGIYRIWSRIVFYSK